MQLEAKQAQYAQIEQKHSKTQMRPEAFQNKKFFSNGHNELWAEIKTVLCQMSAQAIILGFFRSKEHFEKKTALRLFWFSFRMYLLRLQKKKDSQTKK